MERRSSFLTFLAALVPGVGYMYLGLVRKGVQFLALFLLIKPVFRMLAIGYLADIIMVPLWFYTFFDTFNTARKIDRGEMVYDTDFIFKKYTQHNVDITSCKLSKDIWIYAAWGLIIVGVLSIVNKLFGGYEIYGLIRSYISTYFIPVLFVIAGIFLLFKTK